ncbi:MAG: hypothetical protein LBD18_00640 [Treponema sp.]|nr:hypothetical protein [Treponema sp.]
MSRDNLNFLGEIIQGQLLDSFRACSKFYLAGSKRARKSGFLRSIDRKNPQFEQALR